MKKTPTNTRPQSCSAIVPRSSNRNGEEGRNAQLSRDFLEQVQAGFPADNANAQQLRPSELRGSILDSFQSSNRRNPLKEERGKKILDAFERTLSVKKSPLPEEEPLFLPQGVYSLTGQALPPVLNCPQRQATGEDTAALHLAQNVPSFAFQVVNNNYHFNQNQSLLQSRGSAGAGPSNRTGSSSQAGPSRVPRHSQVQRERQSSGRGLVQQTLNAAYAPSRTQAVVPVVPKYPSCVADILFWWTSSDRSNGLSTPLMEWTSAQRNYVDKTGDKVVQNCLIFAKRKTVSMTFFFYCKTHSVKHYEKKFTSLTDSRVINQNYEKSSKFSKENKLPELFRSEGKWIEWTKDDMENKEVRDAVYNRCHK